MSTEHHTRGELEDLGSERATAGRGQPVRLVLFAASPMYFQVPLYRRLAANPLLDFTVVFASSAGVAPHDTGYGQQVVWDVDLLGGYDHVFLRRAAKRRIDGGTFALVDFDVVRTIRKLQPDVLWVHGYNSVTHFLAAATQQFRRGRLLFREEQHLLHTRPVWKSAIKQVLLRLMFHDASAVYIGSNNRDWLEHHGFPPSRLYFAPYCVENDRFRRDAQALGHETGALRESFGIGVDDGPVIAYVGRLIPKKQPLFLLEAFRRVRAKRRCTLLVAGSGPLEDAFRAKIEREGIPDVVMAGFLNQTTVARAYAVSDVFALPSKLHETWGLVVCEAMNFGLPVVVSNVVGCARDVVEDGLNGFVVDASDVDLWADRLTRLVDDAELRSTMGAAGLERISHWNFDAEEQGVLAAVAELAGRPELRASAASPDVPR
jgi:glycosyltransferase involved in cell wall biosynthesis